MIPLSRAFLISNLYLPILLNTSVMIALYAAAGYSVFWAIPFIFGLTNYSMLGLLLTAIFSVAAFALAALCQNNVSNLARTILSPFLLLSAYIIAIVVYEFKSVFSTVTLQHSTNLEPIQDSKKSVTEEIKTVTPIATSLFSQEVNTTIRRSFTPNIQNGSDKVSALGLKDHSIFTRPQTTTELIPSENKTPYQNNVQLSVDTFAAPGGVR
jgi:hypothetical protein